jgi:diguanylate cyclase (GGDEF)-like protein
MLPRNPNSEIFAWFERIETACLALLILLSTVQLAAWRLPGPLWAVLGSLLPMKPESAVASLLSALCLMFLGTGQTRWKSWISPMLAGAVVFVAMLVLIKYAAPYLAAPTTDIAHINLVAPQVMMAPLSAGVYLVLGLTMLAMTVEGRIAVWLSDVLTLVLCLLTFTVVSGYMFGEWRLFGITANVATTPGTLACLFLLTILTVLRRTENGIFSIYAGGGNGGNLARILSPLLLLAPFFREATRARIIGVGVMPPHYITALLASAAAVFSISMLLYLVWRINGMETEINALALRDELTGLHNLRGFHLLADQAMRMAQRSKVQFSVLFIDLDDLKIINDTLGHHVGSAYISESAEILRATFRDTDVLGRIGGDEFAVAGQFSRRSMAAAVNRLKDACARKNSGEGREYPLSLSIGHVTQDEASKESLDDLMAKADEAMYQAKRQKKEQRRREHLGLQRDEAVLKRSTAESPETVQK